MLTVAAIRDEIINLKKPKALGSLNEGYAKLASTGQFTVEAKLDGMRFMVGKACTGELFAYSRKLSNPYDNALERFPDLYAEIDNLPDGTMLDGELICDSHATEVRSLLARADLTGGLAYHPFDILYWRNKRVSFASLEDVHVKLQDLGWDISVFKTTPLSAFSSSDDLRAFSVGYEGLVFKNDRLGPWFKWKPVRTFDFLIQGCVEGTGRLRGSLGALVLAKIQRSTQGVVSIVGTMNCGTGFNPDQEVRDELWALHQTGNLEGKVCEVAFDSIAAQGGLRFPRFIRMRPDLSAKDIDEPPLQEPLDADGVAVTPEEGDEYYKKVVLETRARQAKIDRRLEVLDAEREKAARREKNGA